MKAGPAGWTIARVVKRSSGAGAGRTSRAAACMMTTPARGQLLYCPVRRRAWTMLLRIQRPRPRR